MGSSHHHHHHSSGLVPRGSHMSDSEVNQEAKPEVKPEVKPETHINLKVSDGSSEIFFKIKKTTPLRRLMEAFAKRQGKEMDSLRFLYDGIRIQADQTPEDLDMEDNDIIEAHREQIGGSGVIKPDMKIKLKMEGNVNGYAFVIEGEGEGKPYDGTNTINLEVKEGAPLPFSYDILTTAFAYGNRAFTKYPDDIPNYFKQSFPEGYSWERTMTFEDKGIVKVKSDISLEEDSFIYEIYLKGENFPPNGPVMQKKTTGWDASTERMYVRDGVLKGDVKHKLLLEGGGYYRVDFKTIYRAKKAVKLPDYHFVDHRIEILNYDKDYNKVTVYESAVARNSTD